MKFPQELLHSLTDYIGPRGTLSLAATDKKVRQTQQRLGLSKKEILKALLFTTCVVLNEKVRGDKWMLLFPSPESNTAVAVIFNFHNVGTNRMIMVRIVGEILNNANHYEYHNVLTNKNLEFTFLFPRTMKDQVYTFLHWVIHKYYDRLDKTPGRVATLNFITVYQHKHQAPKMEECRIVKISEDPVFDHMKSCLTLLMNLYACNHLGLR